MIVLDEQLSAPYLKKEIEKWYAGSVIILGSLRPHGVIKDDGIPALLQDLTQPTLITINYDDFWRKSAAHPSYCVICFNLPRERAHEIPDSLRTLLSRPEWKTKRGRMGKGISISGNKVRYYD